MSISDQVREFFLAPANMGVERTLKEISEAIECDDDKKLGSDLWYMAQKSHELHCEKNADGKNVYRWNDKANGKHRPELGGRCQAEAGGQPKLQRRTAKPAAHKCKIPVVVHVKNGHPRAITRGPNMSFGRDLDARERIVRALERAGKPKTVKELATALGKSPACVQSLLYALREDEVVRCISHTHAAHEWKLTGEPLPTHPTSAGAASASRFDHRALAEALGIWAR